MFDRDTQRELTDLEERSQMANFANALAASSADKERALKGSQQLAGLSQAQQAALTSGLVGVEKAATAEQAINQQIRDVAEAVDCLVHREELLIINKEEQQRM